MRLEGRNVLVVGLARTGVAAARLLLERKARVCCTDIRRPEELGKEAALLEEAGCRMRLGGHGAEDFLGADLIVVSPGVPLSLPALQEASASGVEIIGEVELAFRHMECPIVGVTGTNGKTTTVRLIESMLARGGVPHWVGGNIGKPLSEFVLEEGPGEGGSGKVVVAELSSFQLETIVTFRPRVGIWTNVSPDHLDRYSSMSAYAQAKARIFSRQGPDDVAVIPCRDPWLAANRDRIRARILRFGKAGDPRPEICLEGDRIVFRPEGAVGGEHYDVMRVRVPGEHNLENMMCALAAARLCGVSPAAVQEALDTFEGLEHRVEYVGERNGVRFFNDSKATTVDSVVRALACFETPVLLLAGGRDKGTSFSPLREPVRRKVRRLFLYGEAAARMERELAGCTVVERARDLREATEMAWQAAEPGEVVLLSPACSSFDMFRDYEDRGERFKALVRRIIEQGDPEVR